MVKADESASEEQSLSELKDIIFRSFPSDTPSPCYEKLEFGYIEPGHGLKGKKEWILDDNDLKLFLKKYRSKKIKEFTLWCYSQSQTEKTSKRSKSQSPGDASKHPSRYEAHIEKMSKVDEFYKKIDEKHRSQFSPEQKRAWAHDGIGKA